MNEAVDYNELRFLCLLMILTADICYFAKDFNRAFYFYNEAVIYYLFRELHQRILLCLT